MSERRERKLQHREAMIIESAARLIDRVGYSHMTMDMLSEEAGIARATLYQHFKSKEDVMIGATRRALANLDQFMGSLSGQAVEQLRAIMRFMMQSGRDAEGFPTMVMHDELLHLFAGHPDISAKFQVLNGVLFRLVEQAQRDGDIAPDLPPEVVIAMIMNNIQAPRAQTVYPGQRQDALSEYTLRILFTGLKG